MAPGGKGRHRSRRGGGEEEEDGGDDGQEEEDEGGRARRRSKKRERDEVKRGHKRKDSFGDGGDRDCSSKKTRSGENEGAVVGDVRNSIVGEGEKKGSKNSKSDQGMESTEKGRKSSRSCDDAKESSDKKKKRDRYNSEDREHRCSARDDRRKRDRDEKHRSDEKSEKSKRDHTDSRKKHRDHHEEDHLEKKLAEDLRKESKYSVVDREKSRNDEDQYYGRKNNDESRRKEIKDSNSRKKSDRDGEKRDDDQKESKNRRQSDDPERRSRASDRDRFHDDEKSHKVYDEDRDGLRNGEERSRVPSIESSRNRDRSPHDDYYSRKIKDQSRDRSYEDGYRSWPRFYKDERDDRQYRSYKESVDERSSVDRARSNRSSARPDDYSRRTGSYRRSDGVSDGSWSWHNSVFPPYYGGGGFVEHFPASVYGIRSYPSGRFMRAPPGFENPYSWYNFRDAAADHTGESKPKRAAVDEEHQEHEDLSQVSPARGKSCEEPEESAAANRCSFRESRFADEKRRILSRLSISENLAGAEAYEQYLKFVADEKIEIPNIEIEAAAASPSESDDDRVLEADPEAENLLRIIDADDPTKPSFFGNQFEAALKLYENPEEQNRTRESTVGSYILPRDCVSVYESKLPDTSTATRSGINTGQKDASPGAGEALNIATGINFSGKNKTSDVAVETGVADGDGGDGNDDGNLERDRRRRRLDCYEITSGDGDRDRDRDDANEAEEHCRSSRREGCDEREIETVDADLDRQRESLGLVEANEDRELETKEMVGAETLDDEARAVAGNETLELDTSRDDPEARELSSLQDAEGIIAMPSGSVEIHFDSRTTLSPDCDEIQASDDERDPDRSKGTSCLGRLRLPHNERKLLED